MGPAASPASPSCSLTTTRRSRQSAVFAAEKLRDEQLIAALREIIVNEPSSPVSPAHSAAKALGACGPGGVAALIELPEHEDADVRYIAASGLGQPSAGELTDETAIRALVDLIPRPGGEGAVSPLIRAGARLAAELLLPLLDDTDPQVRSRAIRASWVHSDDDVDQLQALFERDPDENVRADAAHGIGVSARPGAYDVLLDAAKARGARRRRQPWVPAEAWMLAAECHHRLLGEPSRGGAWHDAHSACGRRPRPGRGDPSRPYEAADEFR